MVTTPVYLDNQATTPVDPGVLEAMLPYFSHHFGNASSTSHCFGWDARAAMERARETVAAAINAHPTEILFTSGATESNNLALRGLADHRRRHGNHFVSVMTEHKAVLDPLTRLSQRGCEVTLLPVQPQGHEQVGRVSMHDVEAAVGDNTLVVSVMLANNEIGVLQPVDQIATLCRRQETLCHTDATQAVGKIPVDVQQLDVDLLSFSAHKMYGPKGVGALYVRRRGRPVRLSGQIVGGGQQEGLRSGTLNVPGIVGLARAVEIACRDMAVESARIAGLRDRLFQQLRARIPEIVLNGPALERNELRLPGNLNCQFPGIDGEALMMSARDVAVSSGSACTSAQPEPSHVLRAIGLEVDQVRSSLRFGIGRFTTPAEIDFAAETLAEAVHRLRKLAGDRD